MNGFGRDMVKAFLKNGKLDAITEYAKICFPNRKKNVIMHSYKGSEIRVYTRNDEIHLMYPKDVSEIQMESVSDAIAKGTIFDDAEDVDNHAQYLTMTSTPVRGMMNRGFDEPKRLKIVLSGIIGRMNDDGTIEIDVSDMTNGKNFIDQMKEVDPKNSDAVNDMVDHYLGTDDHQSLPSDLKMDTAKLGDEIESIQSIDDEDVVTDDDYEYLDMGDGNTHDEVYDHTEDDSFEEGFFTRKPKKLKPIPRDIIAYITVEMNAIQDSNDQAMLAGYTCSKLDLVDFYLNCIDTQDERYIVPHTREYLVGMQNSLNQLLAQILKIKPVNRNDKIWRANVTLPEGWRG